MKNDFPLLLRVKNERYCLPHIFPSWFDSGFALLIRATKATDARPDYRTRFTLLQDIFFNHKIIQHPFARIHTHHPINI